MRYATVFTLAAITIAFWGFVVWAADAFGTWELVLVVGGGLVLLAGWMAYEVRHAMVDPAETEETYIPAEWEWPLVERRREFRDESSVRHPGLGR